METGKRIRRSVSSGFGVFALAMVLLGAVAVEAQTSGVPRAEHPRPDFVRADWQTLNGRWEFEFDDADRGLAERWYKSDKRFGRTIQVPYAFQTRLSGIGDPSFHDVVWYRRAVQIPENFRRGTSGERRVMLHFGAVDYEAMVWVNGDQVGNHRGGHVGFALDITDHLKAGDNVIVVRAYDPSEDRTIPRGKQYWKPNSEGIWYTRTSGIWQPVWIEAVAPIHIARLRVTPDIDNSQAQIEVVLNRQSGDARLRLTASLRNEVQAQLEIAAKATGGANPQTVLKLDRQEVWSPERPTLYGLRVELSSASGQVLARVDSYFGQR